LGEDYIPEYAVYAGALEDVHTFIKKATGTFMQLYPVWRDKNILLRN
jgi:hypothetical protein